MICHIHLFTWQTFIKRWQGGYCISRATKYGSSSIGVNFVNLKDAGCAPQLIAKILALREAGNTHDQLRLLTRQRAALLEKIHAAQKKVDCLDYLVFNMKQENTTNSRR